MFYKIFKRETPTIPSAFNRFPTGFEESKNTTRLSITDEKTNPNDTIRYQSIALA